MRKSIIMIVIMAVLLCACGKPDGCSERAYNGYKKALEVVDNYLNFELSSDQAMSRLEKMRDEIGDVKVADDEYLYHLDTDLLLLHSDLLLHKDIQVRRNEIAERMNLPKYGD